MANFFFQCPNCQNEIKADSSWVGQEAECPFCLKNCVVPAERKALSASKEYKVIMLEVDDTEKLSKKLSAQAAEGWHDVSQSTVFLSEASGGLMGFSGGTRQEGILYTLEREKR
jgi:hypothetical protein